MRTLETLGFVRTKRFLAERFQPGDVEEWKRLHRDPVVMATLGGLMEDDDTERRFKIAMDHWDQHGFGGWSFREPGTRAFVARGGLRHNTLEGVAEIELLYAVRPEWWNQGVATEIGELSLDAAFRVLGFSDVVCFTEPTNLKSQRVMQKLGFVYERDGFFAGTPHVFFRIRREAWLAAHAG